MYRNNTYKDALESGQECEKFDRQVVIINSLSMLKDVLDDTGNEKLSLILEKGSVEYNIFIILGDQAKYISSINFEKWYKANGSTQDGIWIGNGFADQYQLKPNKVTSEHREEISAEFGYSVVAGKSVRVKVLSEKKEADNDYE